MEPNTFQITRFDQGLLVHIPSGTPGETSNVRVAQEPLEGPLCKISCMSFLAFQNGISQNNSHMNNYISKIKRLGEIKTNYDHFITMVQTNIRNNHFENQPVKKTEIMICDAMLDNVKKTKQLKPDSINITEDLVYHYKKSTIKNITEFSTQYWISQKIKCEMELLKLLEINIAEKYEKFKTKINGWQSSLSNETLHNQLVFTNILTVKCFKKFYGLKHSSWNPKQSFNEFISLLNDNGPQIVGGSLGRAQYKPENVKVYREYPDCTLYSWPQGSFSDKLADAHCITIIGAENNRGQEVVYFIDPVDKSPVNEKRKVLVMSYKRLCEQVLDSQGFNKNYRDKAKFALYFPKQNSRK